MIISKKISKDELLLLLKKSNIPYSITEHPPLHTVEDSLSNRGVISGVHSKNLFLKNKKKEYFLFSCDEIQKVDLKKVSKSLNIGNISFAKEDKLKEILGVQPGSVTPFGLLNEKKNV